MVPTNKRTTPEGGCVDASVKWYRTTTNNLFSSQRAYVGYKGKKRDMKYKIIDPFILFCTRFPQHTTNDHYWRNNQNSASLNTWRGLAFENVCFSHIPQIKTALGINGVQTEVLPWHSEQKSGGAQTDMIVGRTHQRLLLV